MTYTAVLCRIGLVASCGELLISVVAIGIHATGRVAAISFISGTLYLLELPVMWALLVWTGRPSVVYVVHTVAVLVILLVDTLILKHQLVAFSMFSFWWRGVLLPGVVIAAAFVLTAFAAALILGVWLRLAVTLMLSTVLLCEISCIDVM